MIRGIALLGVGFVLGYAKCMYDEPTLKKRLDHILDVLDDKAKDMTTTEAATAGAKAGARMAQDRSTDNEQQGETP